jgi:uncharacterized protein (TIGR02391 family)
MNPLKQAIPDSEILLNLPVEELAHQLLKIAKESLNNQGMTHIQNITSMVYDHNNQANGYPQGKSEEINLAVYEAWNWLKVQGLLIPAEGSNGSSGFLRLGRRAGRLVDDAAFKSYAIAVKFNKDLLHPRIRNDVWLNLLSGSYDTAVFVAFKELEIAVREKAGFDNSRYGTDMIRLAFAPNAGVLTDKTLTKAEQEGMSGLMAGAISLFKNPQSHRNVDISEPDKAYQLVIMASHLIGIVID